MQTSREGSRDSRAAGEIRTRLRSSNSQQPQAPPVNDLYQGALRDYNSARYDLAAGEFGDVLKYYPQDDLAGNAQFYLGEIAYRQGKYADAIKAYGVVLQQFAGELESARRATAQGRGGAFAGPAGQRHSRSAGADRAVSADAGSLAGAEPAERDGHSSDGIEADGVPRMSGAPD